MSSRESTWEGQREGDLKVQEVDAFFLHLLVPKCRIKMQTQMGLIPRLMLCDHRPPLLAAIASDVGGWCSVDSSTTCAPPFLCECVDTVFYELFLLPHSLLVGLPGKV